MLHFSTSEVLLCIACIGSVLQVVMYLTSAGDPFVYLEKAVAAVLFRKPKEKANTSDSKKKKEWSLLYRGNFDQNELTKIYSISCWILGLGHFLCTPFTALVALHFTILK